MKSRYDAIYLSPHLDDAILSCGGQIYQITQAGGSVLIVTIMAGDPPAGGLSQFALGLHRRWRLPADAAAQRRREDQAACQVVGADYYHLDLLDCIYRTDPDSGLALYASEEALFGELHPAELAMARDLAETFKRLPISPRVLAPLTVGHHVDHQLTRLAAEIWSGGQRLTYYEEYPYSLSPDAMPADMAREGRWRFSVVPLSEESLTARVEAITCYESQLSTFFHDVEDLRRSVNEHVRQVGGERLWQRIAQ